MPRSLAFRVTIGVELGANPSVVFLDEPTSGLDSMAADLVMAAIQSVAASGRTIICTIHQPSLYLFNQFDHLLLLKKGCVMPLTKGGTGSMSWGGLEGRWWHMGLCDLKTALCRCGLQMDRRRNEELLVKTGHASDLPPFVLQAQECGTSDRCRGMCISPNDRHKGGISLRTAGPRGSGGWSAEPQHL